MLRGARRTGEAAPECECVAATELPKGFRSKFRHNAEQKTGRGDRTPRREPARLGEGLRGPHLARGLGSEAGKKFLVETPCPGLSRGQVGIWTLRTRG